MDNSSVARPDARDAKTQPSAEQLASLLQRVEAASGADRTLDGHIYGALGFDIVQRWGGFEWRPTGKGAWVTMPSPTHSLDAALALVARVLPGCRWAMYCIETGEFMANLTDTDSGFGPTPPLALLAALLKALASQQPRDQQVAGEGSRDEPLLNTSEADEKR